METSILLDQTYFMREIAPTTRAPYLGCLSIAVLGQVIVCTMPQVIELDEIACPLSSVNLGWFFVGGKEVEQQDPTRLHDQEDAVHVDFAPPLLAAGRFITVARPGTLPPLQWDY